MKKAIVFVCFAGVVLACKGPKTSASKFNAFTYSGQKQVYGTHGAVVSAHPLASQTGINVMQKGGNAFDAAIATQFALAVVYPAAGNLGGGGFMVARRSSGELVSLDFREVAPASAHKNMYLDSAGNVIAGKSIYGAAAAGVPGSVAGILETLKFARLSLADLIQPAIALAEKGFAISAAEASSLNQLQQELQQHNSHTTVFQRQVSWNQGDTLIQTQLGNTLKRILEQGVEGFYGGETASLIVAESKKGGGYISADDLKNYRAKWRAPHQFSYKGLDIVSMGLPSSGGILLNQMLRMVENRPLGNYGALSVNAVQLMTEVERRAYADRAEFLGDADFVKVPVQQLTDSQYLAGRMKDYVIGKAGSSDITKPGALPKQESEETTHISIIDREGNAVAVTTTLNDSYGSKTVVTGAGFLLNNEMDDFSIKPGEPNMYGAVGGVANAIEPGKRMLSSMTPTLVLKNKKPFLVLGTPGGTTIPTSIFQTIVNIVEFNLSTSEAVNMPKFHHQWLPDQIEVEKRFPDSTRQTLIQLGYTISERNAIGRTEVIRVLPDGRFEAVADGRGDDSAEGY